MKKLLFAALLIISAASQGASITVSIPVDPTELSVNTRGPAASIVHPMGYMRYTPGAPALPLLPVRVALPTGCRATGYSIVRAVYNTMDGSHYVPPSSGCYPLSKPELALPAEPDEHIYSYDGFHPFTPLRMNSSSAVWGIPVAYFTVYPARWNPVSGRLELLSDLVIEIDCEHDPSMNLVRRRALSSEARAMDVVRSMVVNPEDVAPSGAVLVEPRDLEYGQYVIISHPDYADIFEELALWKTAKGVPARVYTTDWIQSNYSFHDLQQEMRAFLTDCRDEGTDFVLIVGDDDKVPCRKAYIATFSYIDNAPCDLYFSDINDTQPGIDLWDSNNNLIWGEPDDNIDYHPDLWVGRASVNTTGEAELWVQKVLFYENVVEWSDNGLDYFDTAPVEMRLGHSTEYLFGSSYTGSASAEMISAYVPPDWGIEKCYQSTGNNSQAITHAMFNAGPHHGYIAAHGSQTYFSVPGGSYTASNAMSLTNISNEGSVAILNAICCHTGWLDGYESFSDAWQASPGGGGFAAMNARYGWGHYGEPGMGPSERLCIKFYYKYFIDGIYELGIAHLMSKDYFVPPEAFADSFDLDGYEVETLDWCLKVYNLFGCPELPMWTEEAMDMSVSHTSSIGGSGEIHVEVTSGRAPLSGARVCLQKGDWQTGEVYETGYTDASGVADIFVDPSSTGIIDIHVWAHNHNTYSGTIEVTGVGVEDSRTGIVAVNSLSPVFPSPASASAVIGFSVAEAGRVSVDVFDVSGRMVASLTGEELAAGSHSLVWNLEDSAGRPVPSGLYHVRLASRSFSASRGMVVIR